MKYVLPVFLLVFAACSSKPSGDGGSASEGRVFFKNIADGDTLTSPFLLEMGLEGMKLEPKGEVHKGAGHHHLLVNENFIEEGMVVVADPTHIHYGGGQAMDSVVLAPGAYTLTLQFADGEHVSYGEAWSSSIQVFVK